MGLFSSIISAIGNAASDVGNFFTGDNDNPQKKQQQNNNPAPTFTNPKVNLPSVLRAPQGGPAAPKAPTFTPINNDNSNLSSQSVQQPQQQHASFWHDLTHNPVTNVGGDVGKTVASPFVYLGKTDIVNPARELLDSGNPQAEANAQRQSNVDLGLGASGTNLKGGLEKFAGNSAGALLTVAAPGIDGALESGFSKALPDAAPTLVKTLVPRIGSNAVIGGAFNDTNAIANEQTNPGQLAKNFAVGAGLGGATGGLLGSVPIIRGRLGNTERAAETATDLGATATDDTVPTTPENAPAEPTPPESGTKQIEVNKPTNAPAGEPAAPTPTPGVETGTKPVTPPPASIETPPTPTATTPQATAVPADVAAEQQAAQQAVDKSAVTVPKPVPAPESAAANVTPKEAASEAIAVSPQQQAAAAEVPTLTKTGDTQKDLENAAALVRHTLENPRDFGGGEGKSVLQTVIDKLNSRPGDYVAQQLGKRFDTHLTDTEAENIEHAIQTGDNTGLSDKEAAVVKSLVNDVENPSNVSRSNLSKDYQSRENHFPQVRDRSSVTDTAKTVSNARGLSSKVRTLEDINNTASRFSENSSMGKFTDAKGNTLIGDAPDLGLKPDGNGGYTDGNKTYTYSPATSRELRNAGVSLQSPKDALTTYVKDTLAQKDRADAADYLKNNPEKVGLSKDQAPGKSTPVSIKGSDGKEDTFFTDNKTAVKIQKALSPARDEGGPLTKAFNKATSGVAQATVMNPTVHTANQATNAFIEAGAKYAKYATDKELDPQVLYDMRKGGTYTPSYGKDQVTVLSKLTHGASKINEKVMSDADLRIRYGMFRKLTEDDGLTPEQASQRINKALGDKATYTGKGGQFGIFWHYFVRQNQFAGRILAQAAKGNVAPLVRAGVATGLVYGADKGLKAVTGNKGAYARPPGVIGIANDYMNSTKDLATGQYRSAVSPVLNHVNPLISTGAQQALGVDYYGNKFKNGTSRADNALQITPVSNVFNNNGHSLAEKALNTFGVYTPHVKGDMAVSPSSPGASVLNVKNAQNGSTVAFPKDFTGEQNSNAYNKSLATSGAAYSTKGAAAFANQTQSQQQAITNATKALKGVGITSASDIGTYSKLSPADQQSYIKAAKQVLRNGDTASSATIQSQLVKNGNVAAAANINKSIPSNLSQDDKNALESYSTAGNAGQKAVYLQNNDNAANYYKAVINQKAATGSLTNEDKDTSGTWSGTGNTLAVKALVAQTNKQFNVSQDVQQLYEDTTKTEYKNMSGAQKDALTQYAEELNKNGVIDKFGIADGTSSGGGKGSSRNGLPTSNAIVTPTKSAGLTAARLKYVAPKLAVATVGTSKNGNPFVRSISSSKGVK